MDENVIIFILWLPESYGTINRNEMNKMQKNQNDKSYKRVQPSEKQESRIPAEGVRLNRFLSEAGICSRREADRRIADGRVTIDGRVVEVGQKLMPGQRVACDGVAVSGKDAPVLLAVNKPRGIVCTTSDKDRAENIVEFLDYPVRIYPIGRLDKDSEGLLLMTNEGELVNRILRARYGHEKEYLVTVDKPIDSEFVRKMSAGVKILDTVTRPCEVEKTGKTSFRIILTQGLNRQIRRMCEALGYQVQTLKRVRMLNITLDGLKTGEYREVTAAERQKLEDILNGKKNG